MTTLLSCNGESDDNDRAERREYASSPCSLNEASPSYSGFLNKHELIELLNSLLAGERAGARGLSDMVDDVEDTRLKELLMSIARDEARCCAMLSRHLEGMGVTPGRTVGRFCSRLKSRVRISKKMALLHQKPQ